MLATRITSISRWEILAIRNNYRVGPILEGNPVVDMNQDSTGVYSLQPPTVGHACQTHTATAGP